MRIVIQRVSRASVAVEGTIVGEIGIGLVCLVGIEQADQEEDAQWLAGKVARMRLFSDDEGKMNRSVCDVSGGILAISQFTLYASTRKGNRPSFLQAAPPEVSRPLYERFCDLLEQAISKPVARGIFGADMEISMINDGPVTIVIDSRLRE